ncbi:MAG TPA: DUF2533 family protein [Bacillota bacterium]|nr:DUF2533 family protein [Bacillota bacterium]
MNVHHEISKKVNKTVAMLEGYKKLDQLREIEIDRVLEAGRKNEDISLEAVNKVTFELNQYAKFNHLPPRKIVTKEMISEFLNQN